MKKLLAVLCLVMSMSAAHAGQGVQSIADAGFNNLSESEKAEIIKAVADRAALVNKTNPAAKAETNVEQVERWVKIGANIGQGLGAAAKEVGIAVNEFAETPTGKLTTYLIVWHMMGSAIVHFIGGIMVWIIGLSVVYYLSSNSRNLHIKYDTEKRNIFGNYVITSIDRGTMDDLVWWFLAYCAVIIVGLITIMSF